MTTPEEYIKASRERKIESIIKAMKDMWGMEYSALIVAYGGTERDMAEDIIKNIEKDKMWTFIEDVEDTFCQECPEVSNRYHEDHEPEHNEGYD